MLFLEETHCILSRWLGPMGPELGSLDRCVLDLRQIAKISFNVARERHFLVHRPPQQQRLGTGQAPKKPLL